MCVVVEAWTKHLKCCNADSSAAHTPSASLAGLHVACVCGWRPHLRQPHQQGQPWRLPVWRHPGCGRPCGAYSRDAQPRFSGQGALESVLECQCGGRRSPQRQPGRQSGVRCCWRAALARVMPARAAAVEAGWQRPLAGNACQHLCWLLCPIRLTSVASKRAASAP
jgi:hypothetical protein